MYVGGRMHELMVVIMGMMIMVTVEREERSKTKSTYAN